MSSLKALFTCISLLFLGFLVSNLVYGDIQTFEWRIREPFNLLLKTSVTYFFIAIFSASFRNYNLKNILYLTAFVFVMDIINLMISNEGNYLVHLSLTLLGGVFTYGLMKLLVSKNKEEKVST